MNILALVTGPVYKNEIHGGSYRILLAVLEALSANGHSVILLCGQGPEVKGIYNHNGITVKPILPLKKTFPFPFAINANNMLFLFEIINKHVKDSDIVYNHDGQLLWLLGFYINKAKQRLVSSVRDFVYSETLQGLANLGFADRVIANSMYSYNNLIALNNLYDLNIKESLVCIENGVDVDFWSNSAPQFSSDIERILPEDIIEKDILLCPVRPAINKGVFESLIILKELVKKGYDTHLIFFHYVDDGVPTGEIFDQKLEGWKKENPYLLSRIHRIPWQDSENLRFLYKISRVTLCVGTYPEAFGSNVYVESVAAGTPCVTSIAGAMRTTFPEELSFQINPLSIYEAVSQVEKILTLSPDDLLNWQNKTLKYVMNRYSWNVMKLNYLSCITENTIRNPFCFEQQDVHFNEILPWQHKTHDGRIYDDFREEFI